MKKTADESEAFVPCYSISLLYQKDNNVALRVFISDAKYEKDAVNEAKWFYDWTMHSYKLVQFVAARVDNAHLRN